MRIPRGSARTQVPPGPPGKWLVGNLQDFETDRIKFLTAVRDDYGAIASIDSRTAVISDAKVADQVLRDPSRSFAITENFLGQRLATADIDELLRARPLLNPGLRQSQSTPLAADIQQETIFGLTTLGVGERACEVDPLVLGERVISRVVGRHYFGADSEAVAPNVRSLLDALEAVAGNVFALPQSFHSCAHRLIRRRYRELHHDVSRLIEKRIMPSATTDFCTTVIRASAGHHSVSRLADLLIGSLLAAQRVPAAAVGWMLLLAAQNLGTQHELHGEARRYADDIQAGQLQGPTAYPMALATMVESLRLYPPTWLLSRTATRSVELAGYHFDAGHVFLVSPYVLHRDETQFPNATSFDPHRWLQHSRPSGVYLPFGRGRHRCPGSDLASTCLVGILLTTVERNHLNDVGTVRPDARTTLMPVEAKLLLTPRQRVAVQVP